MLVALVVFLRPVRPPEVDRSGGVVEPRPVRRFQPQPARDIPLADARRDAVPVPAPPDDDALHILKVAACGGVVLGPDDASVSGGTVAVKIGDRSVCTSRILSQGRFALFFDAPKKDSDAARYTVAVAVPGFRTEVYETAPEFGGPGLPQGWFKRHDLRLVVHHREIPKRLRFLWAGGPPATGVYVTPLGPNDDQYGHASIVGNDGWSTLGWSSEAPEAFGLSWAQGSRRFLRVPVTAVRDSTVTLPTASPIWVHGTLIQPTGGAAGGTHVLVRSGTETRVVGTDVDGRFAVPGLPESAEYQIAVFLGSGMADARLDRSDSELGDVWVLPAAVQHNVRLRFRKETQEGLVIGGFSGVVAGCPVQWNPTTGEDVGLALGKGTHSLWGEWQFSEAPSLPVEVEFTVASREEVKVVDVPLLAPALGASVSRKGEALLVEVTVRYSTGEAPETVELLWAERGPGSAPWTPAPVIRETGTAVFYSGFDNAGWMRRTPSGILQGWMTLPPGEFFLRLEAPMMQQTFGPFSIPGTEQAFRVDLAFEPFPWVWGQFKSASGESMPHETLAYVEGDAAIDPENLVTTETNGQGLWCLPGVAKQRGGRMRFYWLEERIGTSGIGERVLIPLQAGGGMHLGGGIALKAPL